MMSELQMAKRCLIFTYLADSIISVDRAYVSFEYLYSLDQRGLWFVTRRGKISSTGLADSISRYEIAMSLMTKQTA